MSVARKRAQVVAGWSLLLATLAAASACDVLLPQRSPGEKIFRQRCAKCHGFDGRGNTPQYMGNAWADLTDNSWKEASGDPYALENVIRSGVFGEMPGYPDLSAAEMRRLVDYVLALRGERR